jgi:hypothetical protein
MDRRGFLKLSALVVGALALLHPGEGYDASMTVANSCGFSKSDIVLVDREVMLVTGVSRGVLTVSRLTPVVY